MTAKYLMTADQRLIEWALYMKNVTLPGPTFKNSSVAVASKNNSNDKIPIPKEISQIEKIILGMPSDIHKIVMTHYWRNESNYIGSSANNMSQKCYSDRLREAKIIVYAVTEISVTVDL